MVKHIVKHILKHGEKSNISFWVNASFLPGTRFKLFKVRTNTQTYRETYRWISGPQTYRETFAGLAGSMFHLWCPAPGNTSPNLDSTGTGSNESSFIAILRRCSGISLRHPS